MKKRKMPVSPTAASVLALLCALLLCGFGASESGKDAGAESEYDVITASDLHYISPEICDFGAYFSRLMEDSDSKLTRYCEELTEAFLEEVIEARPEALLLTGDLSFNGARESHEALADKLRRVEAAGVPVLVLPGNHDVYNRSAARFVSDSFSRLPICTSMDFRRIYAEFGFDEALSEDSASLSYLCPINDTTWALMLDFDTEHDFCGVSEQTLRWTEEQLRAARREGKHVLAAGHQNLFVHSAFTYGYVIDNAERLSALLREYDVPLFLSGHLHIQHWKTEEGLTEIASSALSVTPCQYGVLRAKDGNIRYETRRVDVSGWAERQGLADPVLAAFPEYADAVMDAHTARETEGELKALGFSAGQRKTMIDYACRLNRAYFSGDLRDAASWDADGSAAALWAASGTLRDYYMRTVTPDFGHDYRIWEWKNDKAE